jgi:hypothetical protein
MNLFMNLSRPRLRALLDPFAKITGARQAWKVMYPLREVLFLVWCPARLRAATITTTSARRHSTLNRFAIARRGGAVPTSRAEGRRDNR